MKKNILFLVLLTSCNILFSQSWISSNSVTGNEDITAVKTTLDDSENSLVFGYFLDTLYMNEVETVTSSGGRDYFIAKFDNQGDGVWIKKLGGSFSDGLEGGICTDAIDNVYSTGYFRDTLYYTASDYLVSTGGYDIFLIKWTSDGSVLWCKNIGAGGRAQRVSHIDIDTYGDLLITGYYMDSLQISTDTTIYATNTVNNLFYAKFDSNNGDLIWVKNTNTISSSIGGKLFNVHIKDDSYTFTGIFADSIEIEDDTLASINQQINAFFISTDLDGNLQWARKVAGDGSIFSYGVSGDPEGNLYISGYYDSPSIIIDSLSTATLTVNQNNGLTDYFILKYASNGQLLWWRVVGGEGDERLADSDFRNNELTVSGSFSDTIYWGGIELATPSSTDSDMLIGALDSDGNFRSANSFGGLAGSNEDARSISFTNDKYFTVIRSNSAQLILNAENIYTSTNGKYYLVLGIVGCLPISVDNTIPTDVATCYGDSTGSIQVVASGGFGGPWQYSIDNSETYSESAFYGDLPAGDYQIVVVDGEGCTEIGPLITLTEPDSLEAILVSSEDILHHTTWNGQEEVTDGSLVVTATGGTSPYTFQLLPGGTPQALGTYYFPYADSGKYVVAVQDLNNCGPVETDTIEINVVYTDATGIGDHDGIEIKVYPNPTSGIVNIEIPFEESECEMEVLNVTGQTVLKRQVFPSGGIIKETLDLSNQAKGLYMLRIDGHTLQSAIAVK